MYNLPFGSLDDPESNNKLLGTTEIEDDSKSKSRANSNRKLIIIGHRKGRSGNFKKKAKINSKNVLTQETTEGNSPEYDHNHHIPIQSEVNQINNNISSVLSWNYDFSNNFSEKYSVINQNELLNNQIISEINRDSSFNSMQLLEVYISSKKTFTKIDYITTMLTKFYEKNSPPLQQYKYDFKSFFDYVKKTTLIGVISFIKEKDNKEKMLSVAIGKKDLIFIGTNMGNVLIFNIKQDKYIKSININFDKNKNIQIYSLSAKGNFLVCGFSNGIIILYTIHEDDENRNKITIKTENTFKKVSPCAIIQIKLFLDNKKKKVIFYSSDAKGDTFKGKFKKKIIGSKGDCIKLISNLKKSPYYLIDTHPNNYNIVAFVSLDELKIIQIEKKTMKEIFQLNLYDINTSLPPFFYFGLENLYLTLDEVVYFYSIKNINNKYIVSLSSSISHFSPIKMIGCFNMNRRILFILDKEDKFFFLDLINLSFYKDYIICKSISFYYNEIIKDERKNCFIKTYNNTVLFSNDINGKLLAFGKDGTMVHLTTFSANEYIRKMLLDIVNSDDKWNKVFQTMLEIKNDLHPIYKLYEIKDQSLLFQEIAYKYMNMNLNVDNILADSDSLKMFFNYVIVIGEIDFLLNNVYEIFNSKKKLDLYFTNLEPYITNKEKNYLTNTNNISIFLITLIEYYVNANKKQFLSFLLSKFDYKLLINNKEIFNLLLLCRVYIISYHITINNDGNNSIALCFEVLNTMEKIIQSFSNVETYKRKNSVKLTNNINLFDDNQIYSLDFMILSLLWYINEIIDKKDKEIEKNTKKEINNNINDIITFFTSDIFLKFTCFEGRYANEYFYIMKKIFKSHNSPYDTKKNILTILISKFENIMHQEGLYYFYYFLIEIIAKYEEIDISDEIKIKSIVFLLTYENKHDEEEDVDFRNIANELDGNSNNNSNISNEGEIEESINKVLKQMDSLTHSDCVLLLKSCENTSLLNSKEFILDLLQK